jgi:hypothetical protein
VADVDAIIARLGLAQCADTLVGRDAPGCQIGYMIRVRSSLLTLS